MLIQNAFIMCTPGQTLQSTVGAHRLWHENYLSLISLISCYKDMSKYLSLVFIALSCAVYQTEASVKEVQNKFASEEIVPDVIADFPEPKTELKISYPSGVKVELGNVLTPTQVKDQPKVEWDAEDGALYTLLMTGRTFESQSLH